MCSIIGYLGTNYNYLKIKEALDTSISRGPDRQIIINHNNIFLGFNRLSIMDLSDYGMQPFELHKNFSVCNGELYYFTKTKEALVKLGYTFKSNSDCEILLPLYEIYGTEMFSKLDAEFVLCIYDNQKNKLIAARDPIGIRPLFYGYDKDNQIIFASEAKNILSLTDNVLPFPPGCFYDGDKFVRYSSIAVVEEFNYEPLSEILPNIKNLLVDAVKKRMISDAKVGYLLSGGLDSSLVCSIASRYSSSPIRTFAIGMESDAIDLGYAKVVAKYLKTNHTEVIINKNDVLDSLDEVIKVLETFDITTIRASIGMYLLCKAIKETTDIKVLLTGEISDELFGYKYTDFAPNALEFQNESKKRIEELYMYDCLRADRCISSQSLEARVPFGDIAFVKYIMSIDPSKKMNTYNKGKYLLRAAFDDGSYLPKDILYREKAAFSDAVGHSLVNYLKEYADNKYSDEQYLQLKSKYSYHEEPISKESLLYREIFEKYYPGHATLVKSFWMPNKSWDNCDVNDPSARYLKNYGDSGK